VSGEGEGELLASVRLMQWAGVWNSTHLLRSMGNPEDWDRMAAKVESSVPPRKEDELKAREFRLNARRLRTQLQGLRDRGLEFDFETGTIKLPPSGRRGPREKAVSHLIVAAFESLGAVPEWYSRTTFEAVREKLAEVLFEHAAPDLSDDVLRGAIERYVNRRR